MLAHSTQQTQPSPQFIHSRTSFGTQWVQPGSCKKEVFPRLKSAERTFLYSPSLKITRAYSVEARISCSIKSFQLKLNRRILAFVGASTEKHSRLDLSPCVLRPEYITFAQNTDAVWKSLFFICTSEKLQCCHMLAD